jgi:hypothetical protein
MHRPIKLTRLELHSLVWARPVSAIAKEIGVSPNALGKLCRRSKIPVPPRGYWAKVCSGQKPEAMPLPNPENNLAVTIYFWPTRRLEKPGSRP